MAMSIVIFVENKKSGVIYELNVNTKIKVFNLKYKISKIIENSIDLSNMVLKFNRRVLNNNRELSSYGISDNSLIFLTKNNNKRSDSYPIFIQINPASMLKYVLKPESTIRGLKILIQEDLYYPIEQIQLDYGFYKDINDNLPITTFQKRDKFLLKIKHSQG